MMKGYKIIAYWLLLAVFFAISLEARASARTHCEILTVQASNDGTGIAPSLSNYIDLFKKEPFSTYNSFKLVERQVVMLDLQIPQKLTLPENIGGSLALNEKNGKQLDLTLTLVRGNNNPITIHGYASPGSPLIAAGMKSPKGIWVFGIICTGEDATVSF